MLLFVGCRVALHVVKSKRSDHLGRSTELLREPQIQDDKALLPLVSSFNFSIVTSTAAIAVKRPHD
jgi:hypothetical protein